ncbi:hypothetical protein [Telluria aromaticivorans]|uniref:Uncharacterized protein n=1 Tax=Telluria aromaticivorans TaxID=2725995 RepID=A0A7Y2JYN2_9BURK|nr:hypothetical protein [Telluria aromaticivorans]NNG23390.1 hypothetical protein [Telluria aromaticivorans]
MAIRKHTGNASRSVVTIRAILLVRLIDTILVHNWLKRSKLKFDMAIRWWLRKLVALQMNWCVEIIRE